MNAKIISKIILPIFLILFAAIPRAHAACPVCTVAVGGMMVLLEEYGVDNTISGVWIGGFILSTTLWAANWLNKKNWNFPFMEMILLLFFYLSLVAPLYWKGIIGADSKTIWGADKALLGMLIGGVIFHLSHLFYLKIKAKNGGKPWFPFQRVAMPVVSLALLSLIFYLFSGTNYLWHDVRGYADTPLIWIMVPAVLIVHFLLFRLLNRFGAAKPSCH